MATAAHKQKMARKADRRVQMHRELHVFSRANEFWRKASKYLPHQGKAEIARRAAREQV